MAIDKKDTIDLLCLKKDGTIAVVLVAFLDAHEEIENLRLMQQKLNRYFDFIESGEVYERAMEVAKRVVPPTTLVRIEVIANRGLREPDGPLFLRHVEGACRDVGVGFEFKVSPE